MERLALPPRQGLYVWLLWWAPKDFGATWIAAVPIYDGVSIAHCVAGCLGLN